MQTECLVHRTGLGDDGERAGSVFCIRWRARSARRRRRASRSSAVLELQVGDTLYQTWQEAAEREVPLPEIPLDDAGERFVEFYFPGGLKDELLHDADGRIAGVIRRRASRALRGSRRWPSSLLTSR